MVMFGTRGKHGRPILRTPQRRRAPAARARRLPKPRGRLLQLITTNMRAKTTILPVTRDGEGLLVGSKVGWPSVRTRVGRQIEISQSVYGDLKRVFRYFDYYALHTPKRPLEPCRRRLFVLPDRIPTEYYLTREWLWSLGSASLPPHARLRT